VLLPDNIRTNARQHRVFLPTLFDTIEDGMCDIIRILSDIIMILATLNAIIRDIGKKRWWKTSDVCWAFTARVARQEGQCL
jgi:hypothetical protein